MHKFEQETQAVVDRYLLFRTNNVLRVFIVLVINILTGLPLQAFENYKEAYNAAGKSEKARKYEQAAKEYSEAVKLSSKDIERYAAMSHQAECMWQQGKLTEAVDIFREIAVAKGASDDQKNFGQLRIAQYYLKNSQYDKAKKAYEKNLGNQKNTPFSISRAQIEVGKILYSKQKYNDALKLFDAVIKNGRSKYLQSVALHYVGWCKRRQGQYDQAIKAYEAVVNMPESTAYFKGVSQLYAAYCLIDQKKFDEAVKAFAKVADIKGAHSYSISEAQREIGVILRNQGKYDESTNVLKQILAMSKPHPNDKARACYLIVCNYYDQDDYTKAKTYYEQLLKTKYGNSFIKQISPEALKKIEAAK